MIPVQLFPYAFLVVILYGIKVNSGASPPDPRIGNSRCTPSGRSSHPLPVPPEGEAEGLVQLRSSASISDTFGICQDIFGNDSEH